MEILTNEKFIDWQRFIHFVDLVEEWPVTEDSAVSSTLLNKDFLRVMTRSYSAVMNIGEKEACSNMVLSPFLLSVVDVLSERSQKKYFIDAEFNVLKNSARGRNPATDFAILVCISTYM